MYTLTRRTRRRSRSRGHQTSSNSSSSDDGSTSSEEVNARVNADLSPVYSTVSQSSAEEEISSQSESEANKRFSIQSKSRGRASLLKLVSSKNPDIGNARNLFIDLSAEEIKEELQAKDNRGNSALHQACLKSLVSWVELILEMLEHGGEDISGILEAEGACGRRPSHLVVRERARNETQAQNKVKLIELLASKGALFNVKDIYGQTPLHLACDHAGSREHREVIAALLLLKDIAVDEPVIIGGVKSTLLNVACHNRHYETAQLLLKNGANPLAEDGTNDTPLFTILTHKKTKVAQQFMKICQKKGHDLKKILSVKNMYGRTALHQAIKIGNRKLVTYCLSCLVPEDETDGGDNHNYLLDYRARYGSNVMHTACMKGHLELAIMFHELCPKSLMVTTSEGMTPLHYTCKNNHSRLTEEVCAMILSHETELPLTMADFEVEDGSHSLLKYTASRGSSQSMIVLLKHVKDRTVIMKFIEWLAVERNNSQVLKDLLDCFDYISMDHLDDDEIKRIILQCAAAGRTESLHHFMKWRKAAFLYKEDLTGNNVMHLIAQGGHLDTAKDMLKDNNVDFKSGNAHGQIPLHLAIKKGYRELTKLFLKVDKSIAGITDVSKVTPLMYACQRGDMFQVDLLLEQSRSEVKFFESDMEGHTCLDHAINSGQEMVAVRLLEQNDWRRLLTRSTEEAVANKTTPMRRLIEQMPSVAKFVLDKCITKLSCNRDGSNCEVNVDYELLEDWYSPWMEDKMLWNTRGISLDYVTSYGYNMIMHTFSPSDPNDQPCEQVSTNFQDNGKLKDGARINVTDPIYRAANHPLRLMINTDESKELLNHPVVRLMLTHKQKATRLLYWITFFIILAHLILVTGHSLIIPPPFYVKAIGEGGNYTWLADGQKKWVEMLDPVALLVFGKVGIWIILTLTVVYFLIFLYRVWVYRRSKLSSIKGLLSIIREIALQVFTILFIIPGFSKHHYFDVNIKAEWQWQLGAFAVSLAWFNFILYLQTMPFLGIYILMFLEVLSTLLNFILVVGIFTMSFAVVFCILLLNQVPFHSFADSLGKVLAMLTGDIDYSGVFNNLDYLYKPDPAEDFTSLVFYPISTHIIFVIFIIFMPILIMNLLTGLAVYDIEKIQTKAKMYKRTLEVEAILDVQDNMFVFLWKNSVVKFEVIPVWKRISAWYKLLYKCTGYKETHDLLVSFLEDRERAGDVEFVKTSEMTIEDMREEINDMSKKIMRISESVMDIKTKLNSFMQ